MMDVSGPGLLVKLLIRFESLSTHIHLEYGGVNAEKTCNYTNSVQKLKLVRIKVFQKKERMLSSDKQSVISPNISLLLVLIRVIFIFSLKLPHTLGCKFSGTNVFQNYNNFWAI